LNRETINLASYEKGCRFETDLFCLYPAGGILSNKMSFLAGITKVIFLVCLVAICFCCVVLLKLLATDQKSAKRQLWMLGGSLFGSLLLTYCLVLVNE